ncbi:DUF881 domain-containing protein [Arsenicicoccus cauae]|uniref:DUF881 domain-containing protein n=1 Tax=Arsenicicoccus cauae TaxID=2663847 RepID=UPI002596FFDC|nr:DUF881 domain-containing protein [uncultured Arsenicicoccus sp.]
MSTSPRPRRPDESMTLLTEMMDRPLDPGYAAEADRRVAAGLTPTPSGRTWRTTVYLLLIGVLVASAGMALRQPKAAVTAEKSALVAQIERRQAEADRTQAQMATWEAEMARVQDQVLAGQAEQGLTEQLRQAELGAAAAPVQGPGLAVTVDDARTSTGTSADGNPRTSEQDPGRVQSSDLQLVVNGLWEAGAEAIDVNGHRLTATSAVRFAGEAILVDYRPLTRPYVIHAIGDPQQLRTRFLATEGGRWLDALGREVGIRHDVVAQDRLVLEGDSGVRLRHATSVPPAAGIPTTRAATTAPTTPSTAQMPVPSTTTSTTEANP